MSIEYDVKSYLTDRGLWPKEAEAVLGAVKASSGAQGIRWNDSSANYPPMMLTVLILNAKLEAVKYIDQNIPAHFARALFA